jgi:hypothetical protein
MEGGIVLAAGVVTTGIPFVSKPMILTLPPHWISSNASGPTLGPYSISVVVTVGSSWRASMNTVT